jgi:hypothetical protein
MRGHGLRVLKRTAIAEICRDPGSPECVIADLRSVGARM